MTLTLNSFHIHNTATSTSFLSFIDRLIFIQNPDTLTFNISFILLAVQPK